VGTMSANVAAIGARLPWDLRGWLASWLHGWGWLAHPGLGVLKFRVLSAGICWLLDRTPVTCTLYCNAKSTKHERCNKTIYTYTRTYIMTTTTGEADNARQG
jgi:hypothetical protein